MMISFQNGPAKNILRPIAAVCCFLLRAARLLAARLVLTAHAAHPQVGATASIFALNGAAFAERRDSMGAWHTPENQKMLLSFLYEVLATQALELLLDGVGETGFSMSYWAHLGGFLGGVLVMEVMLKLRRRTDGGEQGMYVVAAVCIAALSVAAVHLVVGLVSSGPFALLGGLWRSALASVGLA